MLNAGIQQHELIAFGIKGIVLKLTATAIQAHQLACLSEDAGKLVHDSAIHTAIVMLCGLTGKNNVPLRNFILSEQVIQSASETAFHSS